MKKFFYLMALVCTMGFFTACSSDDDKSVWDTFKGGSYMNLWTEELEATDSLCYDFWNFGMDVTKAGDNTAKISMYCSEPSLEVDVPEATITSSSDGYTLVGEGTATHGEVTKKTNVTVKISSDNKTATVEFKYDNQTLTVSNSKEIPANSSLLGTYYTKEVEYYDSEGNKVEPDDPNVTYAEGSFEINWDAKEDIDMGGEKMQALQLGKIAERAANAQFGNALVSVAFTSEGKILAEYVDAKDGKTHIAQDYATFETISGNDKQITVKLDTNKILEGITDAQEKATAKAILSLFESGVPVNIDSYSNNSKYFYVDKDFAAKIASSPIVAGLVANLKDTDLDGMAPMVKYLSGQLPSLIESTTIFQAGLVLIK